MTGIPDNPAYPHSLDVHGRCRYCCQDEPADGSECPESPNADSRGWSVSWLDDVPVVSEVRIMGDGLPSIVVYSKDESLKKMWAYIQSP